MMHFDAPARRHVLHRVAEYFRDKGKNVLLLMDSLTRFAQAQREIALPRRAAGDQGLSAVGVCQIAGAGRARRMPRLAAARLPLIPCRPRAMTADPIADASRAILDGHFVLFRRLAEEGHYPAIDIEASISRVMPQIIPPSICSSAAAHNCMPATSRAAT